MLKRRLSSIVLILIALAFCLVPVYFFLVNMLFPDESWTIEKINQIFNQKLPANATDIAYEGFTGRGGTNLKLSLRAEPTEMMNFASQFCGGIFHTGYDPYNAVDILEKTVPNAYQIIEPEHTFYSYSPNALATTIGNRCIFARFSTIKIRIDKWNSAMYHLQLTLPASCGDSCFR
jgi:hypothetical protein